MYQARENAKMRVLLMKYIEKDDSLLCSSQLSVGEVSGSLWLMLFCLLSRLSNAVPFMSSQPVSIQLTQALLLLL